MKWNHTKNKGKNEEENSIVSLENNRLRNREVKLQAKDLLKWKKKRKEKKRKYGWRDGWMDGWLNRQPFHLSRECLVSIYVSAKRFQIDK